MNQLMTVFRTCCSTDLTEAVETHDDTQDENAHQLGAARTVKDRRNEHEEQKDEKSTINGER